MVVKRLQDSEIARLKGISEWSVNNDIARTISNVRSLMADVFVIADGKEIKAVVNVSYKTTALGRDIRSGAVHVYGLVVVDGSLTREEAIGIIVPTIREHCVRHGYKYMIASCDEDDTDLLRCLEKVGLTQRLGTISFLNDVTGGHTVVIQSTI